jgi:hypothetical protein
MLLWILDISSEKSEISMDYNTITLFSILDISLFILAILPLIDVRLFYILDISSE